MEKFEEMMAEAAGGANRIVPGAVVMAADDKDELRYSKSFGNISVEAGARPIDPDTVMWVASCTKLMTTVAALQAVERGLFTLDEDVSRILPEWKEPDILTGFDDKAGEPILKKAKNHITLRRLLTHSSGMVYDGLNVELQKLRKYQGRGLEWVTGNLEAYMTPLTFEPGDGFDYGPGIDWAGRMVERANGNVRLGDYTSENIWKPLAMNSSTFRLLERPDLAQRRAPLTFRTEETGKLVPDTTMTFPVLDPVDDEGGAGLYTTPSDYLKMLTSLLKNDGKLLRPETRDQMFQSQLPHTVYLRQGLASPSHSDYWIPGLPLDRDWTFGLGGIIARDGVPGRSKKGVLHWGGLPNLQWWIDPQSGTAGIYASQLVPPGDKQSAHLFKEFESAIFETYSEKK